MTVYDFNLHDVGQSAFQSFQRQALAESLADTGVAPPASSSAPASSGHQLAGGLVKKVAIGAAVAGLVGGALYLGKRVMSDRKA